jgi:hypothetical protein
MYEISVEPKPEVIVVRNNLHMDRARGCTSTLVAGVKFISKISNGISIGIFGVSENGEYRCPAKFSQKKPNIS